MECLKTVISMDSLVVGLHVGFGNAAGLKVQGP